MWMGDEHSFDLLTNPLCQSHLWDFQERLVGFGNGSEVFYSLHQAGHLVFIGDPASDVYNTPSDPMFWRHHGQIDRIWRIWQDQDVAGRALETVSVLSRLLDPPAAYLSELRLTFPRSTVSGKMPPWQRHFQ